MSSVIKERKLAITNKQAVLIPLALTEIEIHK